MADDMGKIDKSEPCVNISGYVARDCVSKYVTELTTTSVIESDRGGRIHGMMSP